MKRPRSATLSSHAPRTRCPPLTEKAQWKVRGAQPDAAALRPGRRALRTGHGPTLSRIAFRGLSATQVQLCSPPSL